MSDTPENFRAKREHLLLRLLVRLTRHMTVETVTRMQAQGIKGMQPGYVRLLGNLDTEGTRIGGLAQKMGTTRQAVAQLAAEIEKAGFVERIADPEDGRGVIVRFTKKGRATLQTAVQVMSGIEAEYSDILGTDGLEKLKELMAEILDKTDVSGKFSMD